MQKNKLINNNLLLSKYLSRVIILNILSIGIFSSIISFILFKFDIDIKYCEYLSVFIFIISSVIISYFSVKPFKNNGCIFGIISIAPIILFSFINLLIYKNNLIIFLVKLVISLGLSALIGHYSVKQSKKIKIK